jgi:hypothetical protein
MQVCSGAAKRRHRTAEVEPRVVIPATHGRRGGPRAAELQLIAFPMESPQNEVSGLG